MHILAGVNASGPAKLEGRLKALSQRTRLDLLRRIRERGLCVNALGARLGVTQPAVSQHLRILREAGFVSVRKCGRFAHYRADAAALARFREELDRWLAPPAGTGSKKKGSMPCHGMKGRMPVAGKQSPAKRPAGTGAPVIPASGRRAAGARKS